MGKLKRTLFVAIFVSLASQVKFNFITDGFIVAMSVVVMSIFIYCYEELSPVYVGICSGIFSPLFRMATMALSEGSFEMAAIWAVPDVIFFFSYGIYYALIYKYIVGQPKDIRNFPLVILFCDFLANCTEMGTRCFVQQQNLFSLKVLVTLAVIAVLRTILIQIILLAMETYSNLLVREENNKEYRRLISQASIFEGELHIMEKNAAEIEDIMKQAFELYKTMQEMGAPARLQEQSLDISKNAHEVKGDYLNILSVLKETYLEGVHERKLRMRDIIEIEKSNMQNLIRTKGYPIEISVKIRTDFYVEQYFKMLSVVRNLILNAVEAIGEKGGKISVTLRKTEQSYILKVRDNGPGIPKENLETIFYEFFSTKFDRETGDVQRGIGLSLVKDYVENYFAGTITCESRESEYTEFTVTIKRHDYEEADDEVLPD